MVKGLPFGKLLFYERRNMVVNSHHEELHKRSLRHDNIKTQQANKQSNKHTSKQTDKHIYKHKDWGNKGGHHAPKIQPTD